MKIEFKHLARFIHEDQALDLYLYVDGERQNMVYREYTHRHENLKEGYLFVSFTIPVLLRTTTKHKDRAEAEYHCIHLWKQLQEPKAPEA